MAAEQSTSYDQGRNRAKRHMVSVLLVPLSVVALYGCGGSQGQTSNVIKIGVIEPLTGTNAESGLLEAAGIKFAASEVNAAGGIASMGNAKIQLIVADDAGTPEKAIESADKLVQVDHVVAVIGAYTSGETIPLAAEMQRLQVPLVATDQTNPKLTGSGYTYVVRIGPDSSLGAKNMYDFIATGAFEKAGFAPIHRVALLHENGSMGTAFATQWHKFLPSGMSIVADVAFTTGAPTLVSQMTKVRDAHPDLVFTGGYASDGILMTREARQLGMTGIPYFDASGAVTDAGFITGLGPLANGWFSIDQWNPSLPNQIELAARFKAATGLTMEADIAYGYEAVLVVRAALNTGKTTDPTKLNDVLHHLAIAPESPDNALPSNGTIQFDPVTGQNVNAKFIVEEVQNGAYVLLWPAAAGAIQKIEI